MAVADARNNNTDRRYEPALVRVAQADFLYRDAAATFISSFIAALTVVPAFYPAAVHTRLYTWLVIFVVVTLLRYLATRHFLHQARDINRAEHAIYIFMFGTFASGLMWGVSGLYFLPLGTLSSQEIIVSVSLYVMYCCALSAGSMASYAACKPVWYSFAIPCLLPLTILLFLSSDPRLNIIGILLIVFFAFIARFMHKINETVNTSILLRLEKKDLSLYLDQERERVYQLNEQLQSDLAERKRTEDELRRSKAEAETLAADLLKLSSKDSLTGIANRRAFDKFLNDEWNRGIRHGHPVSLIMCDIDHYKAYNDVYGHQEGDNCLTEIAGLLDSMSRRSGELAARYGGEEFAVVLANTSLHAAEERAEQMRQAIIDRKIAHKGSSVATHLTASFGVSSIVPSINVSPSRLITAADYALYDAKAAGRNRVATKSATADTIGETAAAYRTNDSPSLANNSQHQEEFRAAMNEIQLQRWDNSMTVSETMLRKMIESMGYHCNRYDYPPGTVFEEHSHDVDKIDAVLSGCFRITSGGEQYDLYPGDYACIPRGVAHRAEVIGNKAVASLDGVKR